MHMYEMLISYYFTIFEPFYLFFNNLTSYTNDVKKQSTLICNSKNVLCYYMFLYTL